ncbi:hypothetical protein BJN34_21265 [Cupriavidus necator]|uniref:Uncharacterized protein n=1 Tax=Cupriavidus necator TaxID=106590 RepID=A0A1U9UVX6_CUPNE|nr:hypothetical protein BJN34_21265 [Cupriavidus necator]
MATEVFCWGYTAWRTQRRAGYEVSGFIDGYEFNVIEKTADAAERAFCRVARKAWLRRNVRVACGLPPRKTAQLSAADTYQDVALTVVLSALLSESAKSVCRRIGAVARWLHG